MRRLLLLLLLSWPASAQEPSSQNLPCQLPPEAREFRVTVQYPADWGQVAVILHGKPAASQHEVQEWADRLQVSLDHYRLQGQLVPLEQGWALKYPFPEEILKRQPFLARLILTTNCASGFSRAEGGQLWISGVPGCEQ